MSIGPPAMKRNHQPDTPRDQVEEQQITEKRLKDLFGASPCRKILHTNKGFWCQEQHHVRLDENVNAQQFEGMVTLSDGFGYNYMNTYQAMFLMESGQLLIYHNEFPLSLAEAYHLLLGSRSDLQNYIVFSHLNRNGYFCLKPDMKENPKIAEVSRRDQEQSLCPHTKDLEALYKINQIYLTYQEVLRGLRMAGPKEAPSTEAELNRRYIISFDVYKREDFAKNKPRKGKSAGMPDYHVIVCDKTNQNSPNSCEIMRLQRMHSDNARFSGRVLFALVDTDSTLSFVHFDQIEDEIDLSSIDRTLPYQYKQGISSDYRDVM